MSGRIGVFSKIGPIALAVMLLGGLAAAGGPGAHRGGKGPGMMGPGGGLRALLGELNLSEEQKTAIRGIVQSERATIEPLREQAVEARRELARVSHASTFDEAAVREAADRAAKAQANLAVERARIMARVREQLTPEQLQSLDVTRGRMLERREERRRERQERRHAGAVDRFGAF